MALVIAFGHKARTGKDAAVRAILEEYKGKYDMRRYAFADPLKREVSKLVEEFGDVPSFIRSLQREEQSKLNLPDGYCGHQPNDALLGIDPEEEMDFKDPLCPYGKHRGLLQYWGNMRRRENPFYWVDKVDRAIQDDNPTVALISDMRYVNEALMVKFYKGFTVCMKREGIELAAQHANHISETQLDGYCYDFTILSEYDNLPQLRKDAVETFQIIERHVDVQRAEDFNFVKNEASEESGSQPEAA